MRTLQKALDISRTFCKLSTVRGIVLVSRRFSRYVRGRPKNKVRRNRWIVVDSWSIINFCVCIRCRGARVYGWKLTVGVRVRSGTCVHNGGEDMCVLRVLFPCVCGGLIWDLGKSSSTSLIFDLNVFIFVHSLCVAIANNILSPKRSESTVLCIFKSLHQYSASILTGMYDNVRICYSPWFLLWQDLCGVNMQLKMALFPY